MTAQIKPNRMDVSDRFPMLGFAIRTDQPGTDAEVVLATDVSLFQAANKPRRTAANFYASTEHGTLTVPQGDGVFVVPPEVLGRFIGADKLFFGLATGRSGNLSVDAMPRDGSPYVSLRGFSGRTLQRAMGRTRPAGPPRLEWAGDAAQPGTERATPAKVPVMVPATVGAGGPISTPPVASAQSYDDGFGPMPQVAARRPAPAQPSRGGVAFQLSAGTTADAALTWIRQKVAQAAATAASDVSPPAMQYLGNWSGTFITAWHGAMAVSGVLNPFSLPADAFLAALPSLAQRSGKTLSVGPILDTPVGSANVGVAFAPDGQVAVFGSAGVSLDASGIAEFLRSFKAKLGASIKYGYNDGNLATFAAVAKTAGLSGGEEILVGCEAWMDANSTIVGGAVSIGVGFALQLGMQQGYAAGGGFPAGRVGLQLSAGLTPEDAYNWILQKMEQAVALAANDVPSPHLYYLRESSGTFITLWTRVLQTTGLINPTDAFLSMLPAIAQRRSVTLSVGPVLDTPIGSAGAGVVFSPEGQVALFGVGEVSLDESGVAAFLESLKLALRAKLKLGYNSGGLDGFTRVAKSAGISVGEEVIGGAEVWFDGSGRGIGGAVSVGVGFQLSLSKAQGYASGSALQPRAAMQLSAGTTAQQAYDWIAAKVRQGVNAVASDVNPPHLLRLEGASGAFAQAWSVANAAAGLVSPVSLFLAAIPALSRSVNKTISVGPAIDTPVFGAGMGVAFAPDGQVAVFGTADVSLDFNGLRQFITSFKAQLQARVKLGYNDGGLDRFAAIAKIASVAGGEEVVGSAEAWLDSSGAIIGGAVGVGVGFALELGTESEIVRPLLPGDAKARATAIGGGFGQRIGEALDLGVDPGHVAPILDALAPPATAQPVRQMGDDRDQNGSRPQLVLRPAPPPRARALDAGAIATIAGTAVTILADSSGDISWSLPQWDGIKHPNGRAPSGRQAAFHDAVIELDRWPLVGSAFGLDDIYKWFRVRWQYNGTSLGHVYIEPREGEDAFSWGLTVTGTIEDDARLYPRDASATIPGAAQVPALHIVMNYVFDETISSDQIAVTRITLYADGTHDINSEWVQHSRPGGGNPPHVARVN